MRVLLKDPDNNSDLFAMEVDSISVDHDSRELELTSEAFTDIVVRVDTDDLNSLARYVAEQGYLDLSMYPSYWDDDPEVSAE